MFRLRRFLQPSFHSAEGQRVATNHKFESPKSVSQYSALQSGEHLRVHSLRYFEGGRQYYGQTQSYLDVKICPKDKKFLTFRWRGISYQYKALPFGLATAP